MQSGRRTKSSRNTGGSRSTSVISGKVTSNKAYSFTSGKFEVSINDQLNAVTASLGLVYRLFRYKRIKVTTFPIPTEAVIVGYSPGAPVTTSTFADYASEHMTLVPSNLTVPMSFVIGEAALRTDHTWFVTG